MKTILFYCRTLAIMMAAGTFLMSEDALGQCDDCNVGSGCGVDADATGNCSFAAGDGASATGAGAVALSGGLASGTTSFAASDGEASGFAATGLSAGDGNGDYSTGIGFRSEANGDYSVVIGKDSYSNGSNGMAFGFAVESSSAYTNNHVIGCGTGVGTRLANGISNSLMIGYNSTVPTVFVKTSSGSGTWGRVGIGTTDPDGLLHLKDESGSDTHLIIEKADGDEGGMVWHNGAQTEGTVNASILFDSNEDLRVRNAVSNKDIIFNINDGGTDTEVMRIDANVSRVGIGASLPNAKLEVRNEAEASIGESIAWFTVGDATDDRLQIRNGSATDNEFIPVILGSVANHDGEALRLTASTDNDTGTEAVMEFQSRIQNPLGNVANRPLYRWYNYLTTQMLMDANGSLGIGTVSPQGRLHVNGTVFINYGSVPPVADPNNLSSNEEDLGIDANTGQLINLSTSSIHYKENVEDIEFDHEAFLSLRAVDFQWKQYFGGGDDVGMIAQEVAQTFPALASWSYKYTHLPDGSLLMDTLGVPVVDTTQLEVSGVRYHKLPIYLFSIVKEQQTRVQQLEQQVQELADRLDGCCMDVEPMNKMDEGGDPGNGSFSEFVLLRNDPNPFSDYTDVQYEHDGCTDCQIIITDVSGRIIKRIRTEGTRGTVRVYSSEIGSGMFIYSLVKDGKTVSSERMISSNR